MLPNLHLVLAGALSLAPHLGQASAPNVTVVPLGGDCAAYPGYDPATGVSGPLRVAADSTGTVFDGVQFVPKSSTAVGGGSWGFMVIPFSPNATAATPMRCGNGTLQAHMDMGFLGVRWQPLVAAGTPAESVFGFGFPDLPDPNYHLETWYVPLFPFPLYPRNHSHIIDGAPQPGVYLGAVNVTSWGLNYQNYTESGEYYFLRLLGPGSNNLATGKPLNDGEFTGFIKITAA
ncbi:hypothetical protein AAE478_006138 [Parahypoxylon ruwenzoriense]